MENEIIKKCVRIFRSCKLGCHVQVAKEFLNLALKKVSPESEGYEVLANELELLNERFSL